MIYRKGILTHGGKIWATCAHVFYAFLFFSDIRNRFYSFFMSEIIYSTCSKKQPSDNFPFVPDPDTFSCIMA